MLSAAAGDDEAPTGLLLLSGEGDDDDAVAAKGDDEDEDDEDTGSPEEAEAEAGVRAPPPFLISRLVAEGPAFRLGWVRIVFRLFSMLL